MPPFFPDERVSLARISHEIVKRVQLELSEDAWKVVRKDKPALILEMTDKDVRRVTKLILEALERGLLTRPK